MIFRNLSTGLIKSVSYTTALSGYSCLRSHIWKACCFLNTLKTSFTSHADDWRRRRTSHPSSNLAAKGQFVWAYFLTGLVQCLRAPCSSTGLWWLRRFTAETTEGPGSPLSCITHGILSCYPTKAAQRDIMSPAWYVTVICVPRYHVVRAVYRRSCMLECFEYFIVFVMIKYSLSCHTEVENFSNGTLMRNSQMIMFLKVNSGAIFGFAQLFLVETRLMHISFDSH